MKQFSILLFTIIIILTVFDYEGASAKDLIAEQQINIKDNWTKLQKSLTIEETEWLVGPFGDNFWSTVEDLKEHTFITLSLLDSGFPVNLMTYHYRNSCTFYDTQQRLFYYYGPSYELVFYYDYKKSALQSWTLKSNVQSNTGGTTAKANNGVPALMAASQNEHKEIVQLLLAKGVNVNAKKDDGFTALMYASRAGYKEIVQLLLNNGANVNAKKDDGFTALMLASYNRHKEIVQMLLAKGANVNAKGNSATALRAASAKGDKEIVQLLLAKGADVNAKDNNGATALMAASGGGDKEIVPTADGQGGQRQC